MAAHDVIVVGAGANGLVAGILLARAGRRVLVLDRRETPGGQLAPEDFGEGFAVEPLHPAGRLAPSLARALGLARPAAAAQPYLALQADGESLRLGRDAAALESIRRHSARDAARWPEFVAFLDAAAGFLDAAYATPMPRLPAVGLKDGWPLAKLAWRWRRLGRATMFRVIRAMSMSALELTEEWFDSDALRAAVAAIAIHGVTLGPMSAGTGFTLMHQWWLRGGPAHAPSPQGNAGLVADLVGALRAAGGELRTGAAVRRLQVDRQTLRGVVLGDGSTLEAGTVLSTAEPRHTLLELVGAPELPPDVVWQAQSIKLRGSVAKVHLETDGRHGLPEGTLVVAPGIRALERAYDAAKYGRLSETPYLEITTRRTAVSLHVQFAPYALRDGDWTQQRDALARRAVDTLAAYAPGLPASIRRVRTLTPLDLEATWGLTEGDLNHGQLILDQLAFMRPLPGWSDHRTPIDGLWLGGSGCHGGGGVSGVPGRNAARAMLAAGR